MADGYSPPSGSRLKKYTISSHRGSLDPTLRNPRHRDLKELIIPISILQLDQADRKVIQIAG